jgi:hypothetical protein
MGSPVSPGRLFNTPPNVRMSPGKKRELYGPGINLSAIHTALTRVSAALAESQNLKAQMMEAGAQKREAHKRARKLDDIISNLRRRLLWSPSETYQRQLNQAQKELNAILPNVRNKERRSNKLIRQWKASKKRYRQLARRVIYYHIYNNGTRNLNSRPLKQNEKKAIRNAAAIVKNMTSTRRTVRQLPLPRNLRGPIIRSAAYR